MVMCPYDMCTFNEEGNCSKADVVLVVVENESVEALECTSFKRRFERNEREAI